MPLSARGKKGLVINWTKFYQWLGLYYFHPKVKMFMIPDVITGTEAENNALIHSVPNMFRSKAVPVWHLDESLCKLDWLCGEYARVAFGSSGEYATIRAAAWHRRMYQAFNLMAQKGHNTPIHGLRMLDGRVLGNYPLTTADSTNLACNVPKWRVKYPNIARHIVERAPIIKCYRPELAKRVPLLKEDKNELLAHRCATLKGAIEKVKPPKLEHWARGYG